MPKTITLNSIQKAVLCDYADGLNTLEIGLKMNLSEITIVAILDSAVISLNAGTIANAVLISMEADSR